VRGATDLDRKNGPLSTPIYQTSTFEVTTTTSNYGLPAATTFIRGTAIQQYGCGKNGCGHWKVSMPALTFSSGMGAITTTLMAAEERRPCCGAARYLRRREQVSSAVAAEDGHSKPRSSTRRSTSSTRERFVLIRSCSIWSHRPIRRYAWSTSKKWRNWRSRIN